MTCDENSGPPSEVQFVTDAISDEDSPEGSGQSSSAVDGFLNDGPVTISVHSDQVVPAAVVEVVSCEALEWVGRVGGWSRRGIRL